MKSFALRYNHSGGNSRSALAVRGDKRAAALLTLARQPTRGSSQLGYPLFFALHELSGLVGEPLAPPPGLGLSLDFPTNEIVLPPSLMASSEQLEAEGVYLIADIFSIVIYVGDRVNSETTKELFGVDSPVNTAVEPMNLLDRPTGASQSNSPLAQTWKIIDHVRRWNGPGYSQPLEVLGARDPAKSYFTSMLVEDRTGIPHDQSYVELLCRLHKKVQLRMSDE